MSELYEIAKKNHEPYFDLALGGLKNCSFQEFQLTEDQQIIVVWHILDRLKSEGWIDETTPHA